MILYNSEKGLMVQALTDCWYRPREWHKTSDESHHTENVLWLEEGLSGHSGGPHLPMSMWGNEAGIRYLAPTPIPWPHIAPFIHPSEKRKEEL